MKLTVGGILCIGILCWISTNNISYGHITDDYCWRDYDGVAPSDALRGGTDRTGRPIYIGQALYDKKLIPGKIHENATEIHIEFFNVHVINESLKILCTQHPEKFEWVKTKHDEILDMKDKHIFEGGYEKGVTTYIGRAISHGEMTVGKVICWVDRCIRLTTIEDGVWYDHDEFEILTYNAGVYDNEPVPEAAAITEETEDGPSPLAYISLVAITALLIVIVVLLVRRC
ncbi:hypothetical protein ILUMI_08198 [Ignelater luminosus]|uniref:Uncharacterized protein n=1 Tax=Ignelater luminosus TaxID=2038154 RepID=A0A8K0D6J6_IGNLU|nr:hypothetical protein ILUMI_08198 [Ignelater luminosus]